MKKGKLFCLLLVAALAVTSLGVFAGCGRTEEVDITIGMVSTPNGKDDGSFNQDVYHGLELFKEAMAAKDANYKVELKDNKSPTDNWETDLKPMVKNMADVCNVVVCSGFQFANVGEVAAMTDYKDVKFILIDAVAMNGTEKADLPNLVSYEFAEEESGFMAGVAAALETTTKSVGYVGAASFAASNERYGWGFASGVAYANEVLETEVVVPFYDNTKQESDGAKYRNFKFVGGFADEAGGTTMGNALMDAGCDIIFVAAGQSGNGVFAAAKQTTKSVKVIGCDVNQFNDAKKDGESIVLTSALKKLSTAVSNTLMDIYNNTFQKGYKNLTAKDGDGTGFVSEAGNHLMNADTVTKVTEVYNKIKAGTLNPPANNAEFLAFMTEYNVVIPA